MMQDFATIDIHTLLPQQEPFVLVDHLLHFDERQTVCDFTVRKDHLFAEGDSLNRCAIVENIAQTCAARIGYVNVYIYHRAVQLGFIGAVRDLQILRTPKVGERLITSIEVLQEVMGLTLCRAEVKIGDETIATAEMKIALQDIA